MNECGSLIHVFNTEIVGVYSFLKKHNVGDELERIWKECGCILVLVLSSDFIDNQLKRENTVATGTMNGETQFI
jgi:hypothetical protein